MVSRRRSQGLSSPEKAAPMTRKKGKKKPKAAKKSKASSSITTQHLGTGEAPPIR